MKGIFLLIIMIIIVTFAQLMIKFGLNQSPGLSFNFKGLFSLLHNPYVVIGYVFMLVQSFLWLYTLYLIELNFAVLIMQGAPILVMISSIYVLDEKVTFVRIIGAIITFIGLIIVAKTQ